MLQAKQFLDASKSLLLWILVSEATCIAFTWIHVQHIKDPGQHCRHRGWNKLNSRTCIFLLFQGRVNRPRFLPLSHETANQMNTCCHSRVIASFKAQALVHINGDNTDIHKARRWAGASYWLLAMSLAMVAPSYSGDPEEESAKTRWVKETRWAEKPWKNWALSPLGTPATWAPRVTMPLFTDHRLAYWLEPIGGPALGPMGSMLVWAGIPRLDSCHGLEHGHADELSEKVQELFCCARAGLRGLLDGGSSGPGTFPNRAWKAVRGGRWTEGWGWPVDTGCWFQQSASTQMAGCLQVFPSYLCDHFFALHQGTLLQRDCIKF